VQISSDANIPCLQKKLIISIFLALSVLIVYWSVQEFNFVYDDQDYVTENARLQHGLTWENLGWAFMATECGFYQPLTWLTYLVDFELYGLKAGGYHWTNLIFHLANTVLLFWVLNLMTGTLWRSAFVAALFALHPLHVESVAWVAERKDVVSGFFWFLTMLAYVFYAGKPRIGRYVLVLVTYILGVMAKPMVITLPFVLMLLDFWPLGRVSGYAGVVLSRSKSIRFLLGEKIPLILVSIGGGLLAVIGEKQIGALKSLDFLPLDARFANAVVSYVQYLWRMVWPLELSVFYPHPGHFPFSIVMLSGTILIAISLAAWWRHRSHPYLAVGWLWFLGSMVPVIGVVQIGSHANADRYTYLSLIGIFIITAWGVQALLRRFLLGKRIFLVLIIGVFVVLSGLSFRQVQYWQNNGTLFSHALAVTRDNHVAHNNLGAALAREGKISEAMVHFKEALRINPPFPEALFNMGTSLFTQRKYAQAVPFYLKFLELEPKSKVMDAYNNVGIALMQEKKSREAIPYFQKALKLNPDCKSVRRNLQIAEEDLKN